MPIQLYLFPLLSAHRLLSALDEPQLHDLAPRMRTEPEAAERADAAAEVRAAAPKTWRLTG